MRKHVTHHDDCGCLSEKLKIYREALEKIVGLTPEKDSDEGFNEWGEAECFNKSQSIAKAALASADLAKGGK